MTRTVVAALLALVLGTASHAAPPIPVMLLDGESGGPYHDWQRVTPVLKKILDETGLFADDRRHRARRQRRAAQRSRPSSRKYQAVVMNYDAPDERWPAALKTSFEQYMKKRRRASCRCTRPTTRSPAGPRSTR